MDNTLLYSKISRLPDNLKTEVSDFIDFLMIKNKKPIQNKPTFGSAKGMFKMKKNYNESIEDFKDYQ